MSTRLGQLLNWILIVFISTVGTCAMCGAMSWAWLTASAVFYGMFFAFLLIPESAS